MSTQLNPYLFLEGRAEEALGFYASLFGGTPEIMTYGAMGVEGPGSERVMHGYLDGGGHPLMISDTPPGEAPRVVGNSVALSLSGDEPERLRGWFAALADGGEVHVPLEKQMWGDEFGQCVDRFGIIWLVNIG